MPDSSSKLSFRYRHLGTSYLFFIEAPYTEGHLITGPEAQALNQLRLENIRENCRETFIAEVVLTEQGTLLSEESLERIQARIDVYDAEYQFKEIPSHQEKLGAVEKEARVLARSKLPEEATEEEIATLAATIDLVAEARLRVEARNKISSVAMEELLK